MPLPIGHGQQGGPPLLARRERWLIGVVLAACAALVVTVAISLASHQRTSQHGCIDVSAATVIGGSELYRCGAAARGLCTAATGSGEQNISFRRALADACRRAGLPVPRVADS